MNLKKNWIKFFLKIFFNNFNNDFVFVFNYYNAIYDYIKVCYYYAKTNHLFKNSNLFLGSDDYYTVNFKFRTRIVSEPIEDYNVE